MEEKRSAPWLAFLAGVLLGAGAAIGAFLAMGNRPNFFNEFRLGDDGASSIETSHIPTNDEVLDYLDGKTIGLPTHDVNVKPKTLTLKRAALSELKWHSAGQIAGVENPWHHSYACLFTDETGSYILDLNIPVRVVGLRRVFLPLNSWKVSPVDRVVTPKN